jgi:small subunit ribosomal protein S14
MPRVHAEEIFLGGFQSMNIDDVKIKEREVYRGRIEGCVLCDRKRGLVRRYGLNLCRQCFRDKAMELGFKKYD